MTREGKAEGPYREKHEAVQAVELYIRMANFHDVDSMPVFRYSMPPAALRSESNLVSSGLIR